MASVQTHLKIATVFATAFDTRFGFGNFRFGIGPMLNIIPGFGDIISAGFSLYLVWLATQLEIPGLQVLRMLWNILVAFVMGLFPVVGDAGYLFYKPNMRNLQILKRYARVTRDATLSESKRLM